LEHLEEYTLDFDILWNKAEISEKQSLVIFLGGLDLEIKNTLKLFEPKTLKHAYNLARLHDNTLAYKKSLSFLIRYSTSNTSSSHLVIHSPPLNPTKNLMTPHTTITKPNLVRWNNTPP
jgi:hypothetical protein